MSAGALIKVICKRGPSSNAADIAGPRRREPFQIIGLLPFPYGLAKNEPASSLLLPSLSKSPPPLAWLFPEPRRAKTDLLLLFRGGDGAGAAAREAATNAAAPLEIGPLPLPPPRRLRQQTAAAAPKEANSTTSAPATPT